MPEQKRIETERLILRPFRENDAEAIFSGWANDPAVTRYLTWNPHRSPEDTKAILSCWLSEESPFRFGIERKEDGKLIGSIDVAKFEGSVPEIGYCLSRSAWGNGYMTEAIKQIIKYLFDELNIDLLSAFHIPDNIRSKSVLEKCGFEYEITIEQGYKRFDGELFDSVCYSILKSDYIEKKLKDK